jgi:ferredoxin-type protein NapG
MQRRQFLKTAMQSLGMVALSLVPYAIMQLLAPKVEAKPEQHLPLPGAKADYQAFVDACIGCGLCGEVCPPRCILFHGRDGGHAVNTPYINPEYKSCILCGKCMEVCPTDALTVTPIREVKMGIAQIDRSACYPWVDKGVCGACVSVCPLGEQAIGFQFGNIYRPIVKQGCVGCGQCVEVCPEPSLPIRVVEPSMGTVTKHAI